MSYKEVVPDRWNAMKCESPGHHPTPEERAELTPGHWQWTCKNCGSREIAVIEGPHAVGTA